MTWRELIQAVAANAEVTQEEAARVARVLFVAIGRATRKGQKVAVPDFGAFEVRTRKSRAVRNPSTGEQMQLPRTDALKFRAARAQKRRTP